MSTQRNVSVTYDSDHLANLAITAIHAGRYDQAEKCLRRSLSLEIRNGPLANQAADWGNLGIVLGLKGELAAAVRCLWQAYQLHLDVKDVGDAGTDMMNLAEIFDCLGRHLLLKLCLKRAIRCFEESHFEEQAAQARRRLAVELAADDVCTRDPLLN